MPLFKLNLKKMLTKFIKICHLNKIAKISAQKLTNTTNNYKYSLFQPVLISNYCIKKKKLLFLSSNIKLYYIPYRYVEENSEKNDEKVIIKQHHKSLMITAGLVIASITGFIIYFGKPPTDQEGNKLVDEFSHLPNFHQYFHRTAGFFIYFSRLVREPYRRQKLLPDALQAPYQQPPYTLILEITDVLVHLEYTYERGLHFVKRPGLDRFLENLEGLYEIVIFTSEPDMSVYPIMMALDAKHLISHALFRDAMHYVGGCFVKDLSNLNRELNKVIVIDWNKEALVLHEDNLFDLERWTGNEHDTTLCDLAAFLQCIATAEVKDVRPILSYYKRFDKPLSQFRKKQIKLVEDTQEINNVLSDNETVLERFIFFVKTRFH